MDTNSLEKKLFEEQLEEEESSQLGRAGLLDEESSKWDPAFTRRTLRKVDFRVLPILAAVYALALYVFFLTYPWRSPMI